MNLEIYYTDSKNRKTQLDNKTVFNDRTLFENDPDMVLINNLPATKLISLYTIIMMDRFADGTIYLHNLICNIRFNKMQLVKEDIFIEYHKPNPNTGLHKYMFCLYQQLGNTLIKNPGFKYDKYEFKDIEKWIKNNNLKQTDQAVLLLNS